MKIIKTVQRIEQMDQLIRLRATGSPPNFAKRIQMSESRMYQYLEIMRALGGPISYNPHVGSYEYEYPVTFLIGFTKK